MTESAILRADMRLRQGAMDVRFSLYAPWTSLFGVSGSGKTTILRAIAGFVQPESGAIVLGGRSPQVLVDTAARTWLPPCERPVRTAAQRAWLFPGTVYENVMRTAFGKAAGFGKDREPWVPDLLELFRLTDLAQTKVDNLSGGERQRVSLARAVAAAAAPSNIQPVRLLLLDEPFSGMDASLRDVLAPELQAWLRARTVPVLSVTHDVSEAFLLRSEVIRIADGRVVDQGPVEDVLAEERQRVLSLLGKT